MHHAGFQVAVGTQTGGGQGVLGMRRRLESIGGRLDVRRRSNPPTHTVTAWIPLPGTLEGHDFSRRGTTQ